MTETEKYEDILHSIDGQIRDIMRSHWYSFQTTENKEALLSSAWEYREQIVAYLAKLGVAVAALTM